MAPIRKATFNFVLEGISLLVLLSMIASGLIMEYRLPPGSGGGQGRGSGGGFLALAGLSRHDWGEVHFYLGLAFIALLLLHLWLHWRWIWALAKGKQPERQRLRGGLFLLATAGFLLIVAAPWLIPVRVTQRAEPGGPEWVDRTSETPLLTGRMTLDEAAAALGLSREAITRQLGITGPVTGQERLGQLARQQGLSMPELRQRLATSTPSPTPR